MSIKEEMDETTAGMVAMRRQGYTYQKIADKYGISRQGVYVRIRNLLTSEERSRRGSNVTYTEAQWEWVAEEFKKCNSIEEMCNRYIQLKKYLDCLFQQNIALRKAVSEDATD